MFPETKTEVEYTFTNSIREFTEDDFGAFVYTGPTSYKFQPMIGRLVQVRLESGEYGSHNVLLRHADDSLWQHSNQSFYRITDPATLKKLKAEFSQDFEDKPDVEYTINKDKEPETGFIIASKVPDGESTPMRDIIGRIRERVGEIVGDEK